MIRGPVWPAAARGFVTAMIRCTNQDLDLVKYHAAADSSLPLRLSIGAEAPQSRSRDEVALKIEGIVGRRRACSRSAEQSALI
jgi:hypothetical protein